MSPTDFAADESRAFAEPWHARAFAIVMALSDAGVFTLKEFQAALIERVGTHEKSGCIDDEDSYYTRWIEALTGLVKARANLDDATIARVEAALVDAAAHTREHQHTHARRADGSLRVEPIVTA